MLKMFLTILLVVPLVVISLLFVLCATWMQMQEDQRSARKHGWA